MLAGTAANPPVNFSETSTATWSLTMMKRWAALFISAQETARYLRYCMQRI